MAKKGNVLINGRTAVHAGSEGTLVTVDVCWTQIGRQGGSGMGLRGSFL